MLTGRRGLAIFHILNVVSALPVMTFPLGLNTTAYTISLCPVRVATRRGLWMLETSQIRAVSSAEPDASRRPSGLKASDQTAFV